MSCMEIILAAWILSVGFTAYLVMGAAPSLRKSWLTWLGVIGWPLLVLIWAVDTRLGTR